MIEWLNFYTTFNSSQYRPKSEIYIQKFLHEVILKDFNCASHFLAILLHPPSCSPLFIQTTNPVNSKLIQTDRTFSRQARFKFVYQKM